MQKNVASQVIGAQLVSATDGSAFTGSVTCYVTGDGGTQAAGSVGSGACTHEGNGYHTYAPAQAETNYDLIAFTFTGTGAVPVTVQVFTSLDVRTKTGFALSASGLASVTAWTVDVTGSLSGSVGSVTGNVGGIAGTTQTLDALQTSLNSAHGSGSWATATGFSTHSAADVWAVATRVLTAGTNISLAKGTGITGFNDLSAAQVNAEVDTALSDYDGPTNTEMVAAFTEIKGSTWATTDTLEAIRDRGDAAWTTATGFSTHSAADVWSVATRVLTASTNISAGIADAVWDELSSGHIVSGSFGQKLGSLPSSTDIVTQLFSTDASGTPDLNSFLDYVQTIRTNTVNIVADTNELQTDWANGGRLDLIIDTVNLWAQRNAVILSGLVTGAGTGTEVFTISALGITATVTVDTDGNRSALVWS